MALTIGLLTAIGSAAAGGLADYVGGRLSRRLSAISVVAWSQAWGALLLLIVTSLPLSGPSLWVFTTWGVMAGIGLVVGLAVFYLALSEGNMGSVAPLGTLGAVVPFVWGIVQGERLGVAAVGTLAAALVGLVLSVYVGGGATPRAIALAATAGATFGFTTVALGCAFADAGLVGLLISKIVIVIVGAAVLAIRRSGAVPTARDQLGLLGLAAADVGAVVMLGIGLSQGYLSVVGVVASFYPAMTVLLAWKVDGERLVRIQVVGFAILLASIAVMAGI